MKKGQKIFLLNLILRWNFLMKLLDLQTTKLVLVLSL